MSITNHPSDMQHREDNAQMLWTVALFVIILGIGLFTMTAFLSGALLFGIAVMLIVAGHKIVQPHRVNVPVEE